MKFKRNHFSKTVASSLLLGTLSVSGIAQANDLVMGAPNWPSDQVTSNMLKILLEDNLGLEVDVQSGTNTVIFEAMDKGNMHTHPEVWLPNQSNLHAKYVTENKTVFDTDNTVSAQQGMCVTKFTAENTGIKSIEDLANPEMAEQFDTDGDGLGNVWIGQSGAASTNIEKARAIGYGYSDTMNLEELETVVAYARVDEAVKRNENVVFFCYKPHHTFILYDLVFLDEPEHDPSKFVMVQPTDDPNWLENSTVASAYSVAKLGIHYAKDLKDRFPEAARIIDNVALDADILSGFSYGVAVEKKSPDVVAREFVDNNPDVISGWLN